MAQAEAAPEAAPEKELEKGVLYSRWLGPEAEENTLKAGLLAIKDALGDTGLFNFPRRPNGTPLVNRQGFFERLLRGEAPLQNVAAAEASAAIPDVKRLGLQQLLAIRCMTLDYKPTNAAGQDSKRSFLALVDQCIFPNLGQRLLGEESESFTEAQRMVCMRQVLLIYGTSRQLSELGEQLGSDWWLLAVGGTRRYLHLGRCEVTGTTPAEPVCCYRSYTAPNPRDPRHSRILRWQVLLVQEPGTWTEDPLATEQRASKTSRLTAAKPGGVKQTSFGGRGARPGASSAGQGGFSLFGDFDVEELFDDLEDPIAGTKSDPVSPGDASAGATTAPGPIVGTSDIDDFFDSLLDDFKGTGSDTLSPTGGAGSSPAAPSTSAAGEATGAGPAAAPAAFVPPPREPAVPSEAQSVSERPGGDTTAAEGRATDGTDAAAVAAGDGAVGAGGPEVEELPLTPAEEKIRAALVRFYKSRSMDKLSNVDRIARRYCGDGVVDLWAALGVKYSLPPPTAVQWLVRTLDEQTAVQWPQGEVPQGAQLALQKLSQDTPMATQDADADATAADTVRVAALRAALEAGDLDAAGALAFYRGCPESELRPWLWRALIGRESSSSGKGARDDEAAKRRAAYVELREQMATSGDSATSAEEGTSGNPPPDLQAEVEADAKAAWRGEPFAERPEVLQAVIAISLLQARQCSRYVRGTCEIATLLLFVMACGGTGNIADAEADAFWCLSRLLSEVQDAISDDSSLAEQARCAHELLRTYDPPVADLLGSHGLNALPKLRLGAVLFTRSGFSLATCARVWDTLLADPARFAFCDYVVVSMLLLSRGELLQRASISGLAEMLLALPQKVDITALICFACAICAFERRGANFPPRPDEEGGASSVAVQQAVAAAQTRLTSIWGKVRAAGAEAAAQAPSWAQQARAAAKEVAASAAVVAASAADQAAAATTAAAAAATAALEVLDERLQKELQKEQATQANAEGTSTVPEGEEAAGDAAAPPAEAPAAEAPAGEAAPASTPAAAPADEDADVPPQLVAAPK